ncbi:MAG: RluA family pseudouridine synthase [Actinobacteria bacterium]|nr:RluA family pseudouridine synthase [Actinomycetota bacterium]
MVQPEEDGLRLDVILATRDEVGSRSQAALLCDRHAVTIEGRDRAKSTRVVSGQTIVVAFPEPVEFAPVTGTAPVKLAYEDQWLLVVDKPAGMVVHHAKGHTSGTLVDALVEHEPAGGESFRPGIVHRLDKGTSGLLLVAKDVAVHRNLQQMIRDREVDRRYLALVHGDLAAPTGTIEAPIGRDPHRRKTMAVGGSAARDAVTHFTVLERLGAFTLVEATLQTGRTHQIRVHFLAIGHPVVGDPTYARRDVAGLGRQFLHSHSLRFSHPVDGAEVCVESPLPPDLQEVLERARAGVRLG